MDPTLPRSAALAIAADRVAGGVGTHERALPSPERIDLGGRCVLPAFTDAHVHFPTWALARRDIQLDGCPSLAEALDRVRRTKRHGTWIRGRGWRDATWETRPTSAALDTVTGAVPAALWSRDGHSLWLNSAALRYANGDLETPGGVVERDERGEPTGVLRERAAWRFRERWLQVGEDELVDATRAGIRVANRRGVAAVHDKDGALGAPAVFSRIHEREGLTLRIWQSLPAERIPELEAVHLRSRIGDDFLRLGYVKVFVDGALGSRTAWMLDGAGIATTAGAELQQIIRNAARAGWPVAVHAIGDRANRETLDAFAATREAWEPLGLRQRVEHVQCLAHEDIGRFAELGVACSVQFTHAPSDRDLAERFWADRLDGAYAFRSLWDAGAILVNGSDAPIEDLDPLAGIRAAVLRTADNRPAWRPEQALTVEQAIVASTVHAAWLTGDERRRGRLIPGHLADLVVLSDDPLSVEPEALGEIDVVATMVGGRWVYNPPPWD